MLRFFCLLVCLLTSVVSCGIFCVVVCITMGVWLMSHVSISPMVSHRLQAVLDYLQSVGEGVTRRQVAQYLGVNKVTATRYLELLVALGYVKSAQVPYSAMPITVYWVEK